jgi:HlyD family secretion protein
MEKMKKKGLIITLIIIIALFGGIFALNKRGRRNIEVKTEAATAGELVAFYSTSGPLEAKYTREYYVSSPAKVLEVKVAVGDLVKKGDILAELEVQDFTTQLKIAQKQYENAKIALEDLKEKRANQLNSINTGGSAAQLPGQTAVTVSENSIKQAENSAEISRLNVVSIEENIKKQQKYIKAEAGGIVTALNIKEGGAAASQMASVIVSDTSALSIGLNINQYDIQNIKENQEAIVKFSGRNFKGIVSKVNSIATKTVSAAGTDTTVKVMIDVLENDGTLKSGYDVDVDIKIGQKSGLIKIPAEAVLTDKNNKESVYVVEEGIARLREINTGLSSDIEVEVLEGLKEGERVILNPSSNITDGTKVVEKGEK